MRKTRAKSIVGQTDNFLETIRDSSVQFFLKHREILFDVNTDDKKFIYSLFAAASANLANGVYWEVLEKGLVHIVNIDF